jgi:hypothetical protein
LLGGRGASLLGGEERERGGRKKDAGASLDFADRDLEFGRSSAGSVASVGIIQVGGKSLLKEWAESVVFGF